MTGRARVRGKPSHALVEMYTQPIKIVIIVAHFSLRSITQSSTAKGDFGNTIHITGGGKKRICYAGTATELEAGAFIESGRISTLMFGGRVCMAQKTTLDHSLFF